MNSCGTKYNLVSSYYNKIKELYGEKNSELLLKGEDFTFDDDRPFLSVVMRTQGKRIYALKESLLCLESQTDGDFEVLVMAHNTDEDTTSEISGTIASFSEDFRDKVRLIPVSGGTRTTPLKEGFGAARGIYISIYDDDDIIFDNWVETFRSLYEKMPGRILHAYATEQNWAVVGEGDDAYMTAVSAPKPIYCSNFNMIEQLSVNRCPTMSLAFPSYAFKMLNIGFDESLNTTEDWDFLMRTAFVCGVADSENVTSIYRKWINLMNSHTEHDDKEWHNNYKKIQGKLGLSTVPVEIKEVIFDSEGSGSYVDIPNDFQVFIGGTNGFDSVKPDSYNYDHASSTLTLTMSDLDGFGEIRSVRFDPDIYGNVLLSNFELAAIDHENKPVKYKYDFWRSNCTKSSGDLLFYGFDPQVTFKLCNPAMLKEVTIKCGFSKQISVRRMSKSFVPYMFKYILRRTAGVAYHTVKKIKR